MTPSQQQQLRRYIHSQVARTETRLKAVISGREGKRFPQRALFETIKKHLRLFYELDQEPRWIIVPGLRGVGKTTLLAQVYLRALPYDDISCFYLSVDEAVRRFNATLWDIMEAYEEILGQPLEGLSQKTFFFFDEVQYDPQWDTALKTFYDRSRNIALICTGSSATFLRKQISADSARRAYFLELLPLPFPEYMHLLHGKDPMPDVSRLLREAVFEAKSAEEVQESMLQLEPAMRKYWLGIDPFSIEQFTAFGSMPFSLAVGDEMVMMNQIETMLQKIVYTDIAQLHHLDQSTLNKIYGLILLLAEENYPSLTTISQTLEMSKATIASMLGALVNAGLIQRIDPYGSRHAQVRKPSKYTFSSSAFRYFLLSSQNSTAPFQDFREALLEDVIAMSIRQALGERSDSAVACDSARNGATFIVRIGKKTIPFIISIEKDRTRQAVSAGKRIQAPYSCMIADADTVTVENNIVTIPLRYWLLLQ